MECSLSTNLSWNWSSFSVIVCFFPSSFHSVLSLSSSPFFPPKLMENPYFCQYTVLQVLFFPPSSNEAEKKKKGSLRCHNSRWRTGLSSLQICPSFGFGNKWQCLYSAPKEIERERKGFYRLPVCVTVLLGLPSFYCETHIGQIAILSVIV